jgi:uncharacterized protein with PQ loop repeat
MKVYLIFNVGLFSWILYTYCTYVQIAKNLPRMTKSQTLLSQ